MISPSFKKYVFVPTFIILFHCKYLINPKYSFLENQGSCPVKGIVSRDWGGLLMVSMDR
jgi:hypothetical protein